MRSAIVAALGVGLAATAPLVTAISATAADLGGQRRGPIYAEPAPGWQPSRIERWTGLYAGATYGYGFGATGVDGGSGAFNFDQNGGLGTVFAGYNWQNGGMVYGFEADLGSGWLDGAASTGTGPISAEINAIGSLRARAGLLLSPTVLGYVTAGLAMADFDFTANGVTVSETFVGYQLGAGAEFMVAPNIGLKAEYIYTDLGAERLGHGAVQNTYDPDFHTLRAGLSFRF